MLGTLMTYSAMFAGVASPLCFTAKTDLSEVTFTKTDPLGSLVDPQLEYSMDSINWRPLPYDSTLNLLMAGDKTWVRGQNTSFSNYKGLSYVHFTMSGRISASGNVMSLLDPTCQLMTIPTPCCFAGLFMGCSALEDAPLLPATRLSAGCYAGMFENCINLTSAPVLPADTLQSNCYEAMFQNCSALQTAPLLPALIMTSYCYRSMFSGCVSLAQAPYLPARQLTDGCYDSMFNGCTLINRIDVLFDDWAQAQNATNLWVNGVAPNGTFVCPAELDPLTMNQSMVPLGWTTLHPAYWDSLQIDLCKVYDRTRSCQILNPGQSRGIRATDNATLQMTCQYDNSAAGQNKTISVSFTLLGPDRTKYIAPEDYIYSTAACITPKQLTATAIRVDTIRVYDATDVAVITTPAAAVGVLGADQVNLQAEANFDSKTVDSLKTVTIHYTISGTHSANYIAPVDSTYATHGVITPITLTTSGLLVQTTKEYDFSDTAMVISQPLPVGVIAGDSYSINATAQYDSKYIGQNKTIDVSLTVSGTDTMNYILSPRRFTYTTSGQITGKYISVTNLEIDTVRIYDGTDNARILTNYTIMGVEEGDDVRVTLNAYYDDPHAGTDKTIRYHLTLSGADAGDYYLQDGDTYVYTTHGIILPRQLVADGAVITEDKIYDGTNTAQVVTNATLRDTIPGDAITLITSARYNDEQVGRGKALYIDYTLIGNQGDYLAPWSDSTHYGTIYDSIRVVIDGDGFGFLTENVCPGNGAMWRAELTAGGDYANQFQIRWDMDAREAGLADYESTRFMPDNYQEELFEFYMDIAEDLPEGVYHATVRILSPIEDYWVDIPAEMSVLGSINYMDSIFTDVISIINTSDRFHRYQWYHNGLPVDGATLPYYREEGGLNGYYSVLLNEGEEDEVMTCEKYFEGPEDMGSDAPVRKVIDDDQVLIITPDGSVYQSNGQKR